MSRKLQDYSPPPAETAALPPEIAPPGPEFTPTGVPKPEPEKPKRRKLRFLLYAAAALVYLGLLFRPGGEGAAAPSALPEPVPSAAPVSAAEPEPEPTPGASLAPAATAEPTPTPLPTAPAESAEPAEPVSQLPRITTVFFSFSHEHHGRLYLSQTEALRSVEVSVRDKTLDLTAFDYSLSEEEIASGFYELPMLSTGDLYLEHMAEYEAKNAWPEFEMIVNARVEAGDGSGEESLTLTAEPAFELGFGVSYWPYDFDEQRPADSFLIIPWEETDEIRYVVNDPDAVTDPLTVSVDISCGGRHAAPEEYETVLYRDEYNLFDPDSGEYVPTVSFTKQLLLRRPDWMPEQGTIHVVIVQLLATTGERWEREFDLNYPD